METKEFAECKQALDFIDDLKKKKMNGNLHSKLLKDNYQWSVTWTPKRKSNVNKG